jgi:hypothetical protein
VGLPPRLAALALVAGIAAGALTLVLLFREEGAPLTRADLDAAAERWTKAGLLDYDLAVTVRGAQEGEHRIEVRDGRVVAMTTGGAAVDPKVWPYWSVDGLFRFLRDELEGAMRAREVHGVSDASEVILRAAFDAELGYPRRFLRHVPGGRPGIEWEVTALARR